MDSEHNSKNSRHEHKHDEHAHSEKHDSNSHSESHGHQHHEMMFRKKFWISLVLSIPVLVFSPAIQGFLNYEIPNFWGSEWITPLFSIVIFFYGGLPFLKMAKDELSRKKPGMMTLISLAILVAFVYSLATLIFSLGSTFFWELVSLIDIMLLGHWIEMRSVRKASGALNELAKLMPDDAERIESDGEVTKVSVDELNNNDLILVRPGANVPADGEVEEGQSEVNEAMITGESTPVSKEPGDKVIGGTINGDGSLRIRVSATGNDTTLAGIMRLIEQAQTSKSDSQILADKAAGWLFYIALGTAIITAIAWVIAIGFEVSIIARVATVLVIACPHALGLAVPLVVAITTAKGAANGILIRDRLALETMREIDTVIFDKTGTLTQGEFGVVEIANKQGFDDEDVLKIAAAIEGDSEHTIAKGIRNKATEMDLDVPAIEQFEALKGRGVRANVNEKTYYVGGPRLLEYLEISLDESFAEFEKNADQEGNSVVFLVTEDEVVGGFSLADVIRDESYEAIKKLHAMDKEVVMLTGDSDAVAKTVAGKLGIDSFEAEILPEDKDEIVQRYQKQGKKIAMVGDGVNDAPALTRADVGIAIGSGTDVAVESAGIILVKSNPMDVVKIFGLSKASYRKMIQNLIWASGYNLVALPLAAGVLAPIGFVLSPAVGAVMMSLSTVIVAINAQFLRGASLR